MTEEHSFIEHMKEIGDMAEEDRGKDEIGISAHEAVEQAHEGPTDLEERPGELAEIISAAFVELAELQGRDSFPALFYVGTDHRVYRLDAHTPPLSRREAHLAGALVVQAKHDLGQALRESSDGSWTPTGRFRQLYEGNWTPPSRNAINDLGPDRETQKAMAKLHHPNFGHGDPVLAVITDSTLVVPAYQDPITKTIDYADPDEPNAYRTTAEGAYTVLSRKPLRARVWADRSDNEQRPGWHNEVFWGWLSEKGSFCFYPTGNSKFGHVWTHNYQKL